MAEPLDTNDDYRLWVLLLQNRDLIFHSQTSIAVAVCHDCAAEDYSFFWLERDFQGHFLSNGRVVKKLSG